MPIISITQEMLDRGKVPETGWSHASLNEIQEFPSKDKGSMNYLFEFFIESGPNHDMTNSGRYTNVFFNSKALGLNGGKGIPEVQQRFKLMVAALLAIPINDVGADDYDTDKWKGRSCWIKIESVTDNTGKLAQAVTDFSDSLNPPF